jgi:hypothetical protein
MMNLEERINRAEALTGGNVVSVLRAAFPELFTDPPTAWIAPWDMTKEMGTAAWDRFDNDSMAEAYAGMRDAYLAFDEPLP